MKRRWTDAELSELRASYADEPTWRIAQRLGRTEKQVYMQAIRLGMKKSEAYMAGPHSGRLRPGATIGGKTRFSKGNKPWNAGIKGWQPNNHGTRFKKGDKPVGTLPIGSERKDKEGYLERKASDTGVKRVDWRRVHHIVWEEHNGSIPTGHIVVFRDGNKDNITIENLELITRQENMIRNSVHRLPKELALVVQLKGAVQRQINKRLGK